MFNKTINPQQTFTDSILVTRALRETVDTTRCPACKQATLKLSTYTSTSKDWGAAVICGNCNFKGEVNSTGFTFSKVDSKGKAKE